MADNRMYLRCKGCGKTIVLAKFYVSTGWYMSKEAQEKGAELEKFIEDHAKCCNHIGDYDQHVEFDCDFEPFELVYENSPEFAEPEESRKQYEDYNYKVNNGKDNR